MTGAAGLTGSAIVQRLLEEGHDVTGVVRRPEAKALVPGGVRVELADVADHERMARLLKEHDVLLHGAGVRLGAHIAKLDLRALANVVVISTSGIRSHHRASVTEYQRNETALRVARPNVTLLRPTMIYGSRRDRNVHHVVALARCARMLPLIGSGGALMQPVHYLDVAAAACALVARSDVDADVGGAAAVSVRAAGETIFAALGLPPRFVSIPSGVARGAAAIVDRVRGSRLRERIERFSEDRTADNTLLLRETDVRPMSFDVGVRRMIQEGA